MAWGECNGGVFPAGAGMNRTGRIAGRDKGGVPRRRGDEPVRMTDELRYHLCSPQARG